MNEFEQELGAAGDALRALSDGPGREAAEALSAAFDGAGQRIEAALGQAARSGELDFRRMADGIIRELARGRRRSGDPARAGRRGRRERDLQLCAGDG